MRAAMQRILTFALFWFVVQTTVVAHETMLGGWKEQNVEDKDLQDLSWRAMKGINEQSNDMYHLMPVKLLSAKSQVVAGMQYELEILVGQSECRKNQLSSEDVNAENCKEKEGGRRQVYVVTVWQKPWENFEQFTIKEIKETS
nr:cysteine protease inhibitor [Baylisascaris schroederi]